MIGRILTAWDRYWFAAGSPRDLAVVRIALTGLQLGLLLCPFVPNVAPGLSLEHQRWLTTIAESHYTPIPALKVLLLPLGWGVRPGAVLLTAIWWVAVVSAATALVGLLTRPSLLLLSAASTVLVAHSYSYGEFHHTESLHVILLWVLAFSPAGAALSLDRRLRGSPADAATLSRFPLLTGRWLLALCYLSAGFSKLVYGGASWFNGHTLAYYFAHDTLRADQGWAGAWLAAYPKLLIPLSFAAVAFELAFVLAVLWPRSAPFFVVGGVLMHLGIWIVHGPPFLQMVVLYVVFLGSRAPNLEPG